MSSTRPNQQIKKEPFDNDDDVIEILNEITHNNETRNNVRHSTTSFAVKSEFDTTNESNKDEKNKAIKTNARIII